MDQDILSKALEAAHSAEEFAFATVIESTRKGTPQKAGAKMVVFSNGQSYGTIGGGRNEKDAHKQCLKAIKTKKTALITYDYFGQVGQSVCGGQIKVFIEPFVQKKRMLLCGAGHIAHPLSMIIKMLGYHVTLIDNRREYANKKRYPHVDKIIVSAHKQALKKCVVDSNTHIMIVTQGNEFDYICLEHVISSDAGYIGVISSKAKRIKFFNRLKKAGITAARLKKIHIPAGLDIGAQKPSEIAVSIAAELIQISNRDLLDTDKFLEKIKNINS